MELPFIRDFAMYAAIFGAFSFVWFGWAQENPPKKWRAWLGIGSGLGFLVGAFGGLLSSQNWHAGSALKADSGAYGLYLTVVATEVILSLVGALYLQKRGKNQFVAPWIALVVGIHFAPLAIVFRDAWLYLLAGLVAAGVVTAYAISKRTKLPVNTLACAFTGLILLVFAIRGLTLFWMNQ